MENSDFQCESSEKNVCVMFKVTKNLEFYIIFFIFMEIQSFLSIWSHDRYVLHFQLHLSDLSRVYNGFPRYMVGKTHLFFISCRFNPLFSFFKQCAIFFMFIYF